MELCFLNLFSKSKRCKVCKLNYIIYVYVLHLLCGVVEFVSGYLF